MHGWRQTCCLWQEPASKLTYRHMLTFSVPISSSFCLTTFIALSLSASFFVLFFLYVRCTLWVIPFMYHFIEIDTEIKDCLSGCDVKKLWDFRTSGISHVIPQSGDKKNWNALTRLSVELRGKLLCANFWKKRPKSLLPLGDIDTSLTWQTRKPPYKLFWIRSVQWHLFKHQCILSVKQVRFTF